jgi:hypothetical protein
MLKRITATVALVFSLGASAHAQSTINPNLPLTNSDLTSLTMRQQFQAAASDINGIIGMHAGSTTPPTPYTGEDWLSTGTSPAVWSKWSSVCSCWGTVAQWNLTTGVFSFNINSVNLLYTAPITVSYGVGTATVGLAYNSSLALGGGNIGINYGHSGTYSVSQTYNLNSASLPAPQTGTILQLGQANGVPTRIELDSFASIPRYTCVRFDGTATSPTVLQSGDEICSINVFGYNGLTVVGPQAALRTYAAQNWVAGSAYGTYLRLGTTINGGTTLTDALSIENDGGITLGSLVGATNDKGSGTINGLGFYVSGNSVAYSASSPLALNATTGVLTCSTCVTGTSGALTSGTTTTSGYTAGQILGSTGSVLSAYSVNGSGNVVLTTSATLITPVLGVAAGTSLALGGATIGSNALAITGTFAFSAGGSFGGALTGITTLSASGQITSTVSTGIAPFVVASTTNVANLNASSLSGATFAAPGPIGSGTASTGAFTTLASTAHTITSASASALAVGLNGATNPAFVVNASTALQAAGLSVTGAVTGGTVAIAAIDSGSNTNITINAKGSGAIGIGNISTGAVTITPATTLSAALTYGGVTLSNSVTGNGSMVLSASPTLSGTIAGNITLSGNDTFSGQLIGTGTSAPSSAAGNSVLLGTLSSAPSLSNNGQAFLYNTAANGAVVQGQGSTYDAVLADKAGSIALGVTTGSQNVVFGGTMTAASLSTPSSNIAGSLCATSVGLFLYLSGSNCYTSGTATAVVILTTTVSSGTPGDVIGITSSGCSSATPCMSNVALQNQSTTAVSVCDIILTSATTCNNGGSAANNGTYTTPTGAIWLDIIGCGGGAGGGSSGSGSTNTGTAGNTTTFGTSLLTGNGGAGGGAGNNSAPAAGGAGGSATGGDQNISGGTGGYAASDAAISTGTIGGSGGNSAFYAGGGAVVSPGAGGAGVPNACGGGAGAGGGGSTFPGGGGGAGGAFRKIISSPSSSYPYAVGALAAGGTAGTGGSAGGAGSAGRITVIAHFNY